MSDRTPETDPLPLPVAPLPRPIGWLCGAIVATAFASVLAAHLPDRIKLLGLFPLAWGAALGSGLSWWANECHLKSTRRLLLISSLLFAAGEAGIVMEAWRVYRTDLQRQFKQDPSAGFVKQAQKSANNASPEEIAVRQQLQAEVDRVDQARRRALALPAFLQRRLKSLGSIPHPWPEVFWATEIILGSVCGIWAIKKLGWVENSSAGSSAPTL